jgi:hypothetical protein
MVVKGLVDDGLAFAKGGGKGRRRGAGGGEGAEKLVEAEEGHRSRGDKGRSASSSKSGPKSKGDKRSSPASSKKDKSGKRASSTSRAGGTAVADAAAPAPAAQAQEWRPTRSVLQQGARETGVKVGEHVPGQGLRR